MEMRGDGETPNGRPPAAVRIDVVHGAQGPSIQVSHALQGGWAVAVQVLLDALRIAIGREREVREAASRKPLIEVATSHPRFRPERG